MGEASVLQSIALRAAERLPSVMAGRSRRGQSASDQGRLERSWKGVPRLNASRWRVTRYQESPLPANPRGTLLQFPRGQAEQVAGNDQLLNLLGAFEDIDDLGSRASFSSRKRSE